MSSIKLLKTTSKVIANTAYNLDIVRFSFKGGD